MVVDRAIILVYSGCMKDILALANDNLVMEPLDALVLACAVLGGNVEAPHYLQDDDDDFLHREVSCDGKKFPVSFNGEQWESGII